VASAGYSGTPLARKLGIKEGHLLGLVNAPPGFAEGLDLPGGVRVVTELGRLTLDVVVLFVLQQAELRAAFPKMARRLCPDGSLWVSWPKITARKKLGLDSDMTEDAVRAVAFPNGFVDIKVCAVDEVWSGLRCVLRRENRPPSPSKRR
jgi:hypothetical protein